MPYIGLATGLMSIAGALIAVGREKQARVDLEKRFDEAKASQKEEQKKAERALEKLEERTSELETAKATHRAKEEEIRSRLEEVRRDKASIEAVDSLRTGLSRVEGTLAEVARRLDVLAQEILKHHDIR
jgi:chromosome segregation ATPase